MATPVVVAGAGGFGRDIYEYLLEGRDRWRLRGFLDDHPHDVAQVFPEAVILGDMSGDALHPDDEVVLALGNPAARRRMATTLAPRCRGFATIIHDTAWIATTAKVGAGCVVGPFAHVGPKAVIGDYVVLNTYCSVAHDAQVGAASVLSPYATVNGTVRLGDACFLGTKAVVTPGLVVGDGAMISAGSVAFSDIPAGGRAKGIPAEVRTRDNSARPVKGDPGR